MAALRVVTGGHLRRLLATTAYRGARSSTAAFSTESSVAQAALKLDTVANTAAAPKTQPATSPDFAADDTLGVNPSAGDSQSAAAPTADLAKMLFDACWASQLAQRGPEGMVFPREIVWLSGAPGAGKGSVSAFIMKERDIPTRFEVSSLLSSPEMARMKANGELIGDRQVFAAVLEELLSPRHRQGVIVDGFPRTSMQAQFIQLLYEKMNALWHDSRGVSGLRDIVRRPMFQIAVLYVDEAESVKRQLYRGKEIIRANKMVQDTGVGELAELRATDTSEEAARKRYQIFKEEVSLALQTVRDKFDFHFIEAGGSREDVHQRVLSEFHYQSSHDLAEETYDFVRGVVAASDLIKQVGGCNCTSTGSPYLP